MLCSGPKAKDRIAREHADREPVQVVFRPELARSRRNYCVVAAGLDVWALRRGHDGVAGVGNTKCCILDFVEDLRLLQTALMLLVVPSIAMTSTGV